MNNTTTRQHGTYCIAKHDHFFYGLVLQEFKNFLVHKCILTAVFSYFHLSFYCVAPLLCLFSFMAPYSRLG